MYNEADLDLYSCFADEEIMVTITLPPQLEEIVMEQARLQGTTVELLTLDALHLWFAGASSPPSLPSGASLADALSDYIGAISTKDKYPEGSTLSENTGRKFAQGMVEKRKQGKL